MEFIYLPVFVKQIKALAKKYPSLKQEFASLLQVLNVKPTTGTALGANCFKIRLAIKSKNRGKSGGARVITLVQLKDDKIYFLTVYDKSEQTTLSDKDLRAFIEFINSMKGK